VRKQLIVLCGGILGAGLLFHWWQTHNALFAQRSEFVLWAAGIGILGFPASMVLQIERTRLILGMKTRASIVRPILMAHGINVLLPSMLGDLYEIGALSKSSGLTKHAVLVRLIHRFSTTLAALLLLAAFAIGTLSPSMGFPLLVMAFLGPFILDLTTQQWSRRLKIPGGDQPPTIQRLGSGPTFQHICLAFFQHSCSATGVFFLGIAVGEAIGPGVAAAMLSLADMVTYLPVPIGGIGVHHWTTTSAADWLGSVPASLVAANHGWVVLSGIICIGLANWVFDRAK